MRVLSGLLLSVFAVTGPTACNDDNDKNTATLTVSTDALVLGGEAGESETFTITTTAAWYQQHQIPQLIHCDRDMTLTMCQ